MNGILSDKPVGLLDPRSMALMQMGLGLMGGPSRTPVSFGQSLGQAGMQGLQAFQQTNVANRQAELAQMQMDEARRAAQERSEREAAMQNVMARPEFAPYADLIKAGQFAPVLERVMPKAKEHKSLFSPVNPKDYTPESVQRFTQTGDHADLVRRPDEPKDDDFTRALKESGIHPGTPQWTEAHRQRALKLQSQAPLVQMPAQETSFQKKVGEQMGEQYAGLLKADMNAPATIAKYQRLGNLLGQVNTGKFKGATTEIKAAAKAIGIDLTALGIPDDVAPAQAARALSNQIALELRNPAGGAGMPGALSDKDREFLIQSIPGLENDPAAIPKMIEYRVKLAQREQQVAKMARAYRKKHGKFDEGFYDELQEWSEKNPLFANETAQTPTPQSPGPQRIKFDANGNPIP